MSMTGADNSVSTKTRSRRHVGARTKNVAARPSPNGSRGCASCSMTSLERAWSELNQWRRDGAPQTTVEALMLSLRDGVGALGRSATLRRLSELSEAQLREVAVRVQKFQPEIAQPWGSEDVEVLIAARSRVHA
jgi:hypothetical protein